MNGDLQFATHQLSEIRTDGDFEADLRKSNPLALQIDFEC